MKLIVTGATGYIGSRFMDLALKRGHDVIMLSRKRPISRKSSWFFFDLLSDQSIVLPLEVDAIVHFAANTSHINYLEEESEVVVAQRLIKIAQETRIRFIFVSSQTARVDAPTSYGRIKWRIEQEVLSSGAWVARLGQVYGGELRGLFGILVNTVHRLPMLPAFFPAPLVQPIHVDDCVEGLLRITERYDLSSNIYSLATPKPVLFSEFLETIAKARLRCSRIFIPVPVTIINMVAAIIGKTLRTRLALDRLQSLFHLPVMETQTDLTQLDLQLRSLHSGMHPSGCDRRRKLLKEGCALLTFVLKVSPSSTLLRRYVKVVEQLRNGQSLDLPRFVLAYPIFLSLFKKTDWSDLNIGEEFIWRLDAATILAEATPLGARRFWGRDHGSGVLGSFLSITKACVCEFFWKMLRISIFPLIRSYLRSEKAEL